MKLCFLLFSFFLVPQHLAAQQLASIYGYVSNDQSGETLISANIALQEGGKGTATNSSGYYALTGIVPGSYTLVVSYVGFRLYKADITLKAGEERRLDIQLTPEGYRLDELLVQSQTEQFEQQNVGTAQLQTELVKKVPSVFQADLFRSLQLLPGVKAASDFSSGLYIRGGSPDQTLILLDRTTVYNPTHFFGFFSTFNPDAIKDVRLFKGGYPAKYGGRLGSVLSVYNKDGNRNEFRSSLTLGLLASRFSAEGPLKDGSFMFAVRRSTLEPLLTVLQRSSDNIPESFYFLDLNGKINMEASPNNKFSVALYAGTDDLNFPFAEDARIRLNYGNQTLSSTWTHLFSDKTFSSFTLTGSRYFNFPSFSIASTPYQRSNNIFDLSVKGDIEYLPNTNHQFSSGFWMGSLTLKLHDQFDGEKTFQSRIHSNYGSLYLQDEWAIADKWMVNPGLRLSAFDAGDYLRLEPRISLEFRPTDRFRLQAAYGRYNQFITLVSNEAFSGFDVWLTTDHGVPPSYGDQFVFGTKTVPWTNHHFDVELYYRSMKNLFEPDPFLPDQTGLPYPEIFRFGKGYAYGAEIFFERKVSRLTGFIGYTFSVTRRKFPDYNEPLTLNNPARFYPPKHDRSHDLNVVLEYEWSSRWSTTLSFNYASGQAFTKPLGRTAAWNFPTSATRVDQVLVGRVNASRLPPYHRLDIGFNRRGTFFRVGKAKWQLQVINVYSRRNVWFYNYDLHEIPAEREVVQLLPVLPSISYTLEF